MKNYQFLVSGSHRFTRVARLITTLTYSATIDLLRRFLTKKNVLQCRGPQF